MSTVTVTRVVRVPVARVWTIFTDLPARAGWLSTVDDVRVITPGGFGAGTVWRETRTTPDGDQVAEEFRVEECDAPARLVISSPGNGADYRITYTFRPHALRPADATAVTVVLEGTASGSAGRMLAFVLGGLAARVVEGALRRDLTDLAAACPRC